MFKPKEEVYKILSELSYWVSQREPNKFKELPSIIFKCSNNAANLDLDNEILSQDVVIIIDVYAKTSSETTRILEEVESKMRENLYRMTFSSDEVPSNAGIYRINARFEKTI